MEALTKTRHKGFAAGLVVMATGLGKTWLAAFDSTRPAFRRTLYVAHREEILCPEPRRVPPSPAPPLISASTTGKEKSPDSDVALRYRYRRSVDISMSLIPTAFDYIVIDEFHHASASSYRKLIDHFRTVISHWADSNP